MKKIIAASTMVLALFAAEARAGVLGNFLANGFNILEDGSRELFINRSDPVAGVTSIDAGDILVGFSKIVGITPQNNYVDNSVYAVFSQTFASISADLNPGAGLLRTFEFVPTVAAGFTLADLLGPIAPGGLSPTSMVAVVSANVGAFSHDLEFQAPPDVGAAGIDFSDYLSVLSSQGSVDAVFGLLPGSTDFFSGQTAIGLTNAQDFVSNLALAPGGGVNLVNFEAKLGLTYDNPSDFIVITSPGQVIGGTARLPGPGENVAGVFTFVDDADLRFSVRQIPEPSSIAVWGVLALAGLRFRRSKR